MAQQKEVIMKKWLATFVALFALVVFVNDASAWGRQGWSSGYYYTPGPVVNYSYPGYYYPSSSYYVSPSYYPGTVYTAPPMTYYPRTSYYYPARTMYYYSPTMTWRYGW